MQVTFVLGQLDLDPWIRRIVAVAMPNSLPIAFVCLYQGASGYYVRRPPRRSSSPDRDQPSFSTFVRDEEQRLYDRLAKLMNDAVATSTTTKTDTCRIHTASMQPLQKESNTTK
jgi:hypothetical protein